MGSSDLGLGGGYHSLSNNVPTSRQRLGIVARAGCDRVEVQTHGVKGLVVLVGAGDHVECVCRAGVLGEAGEGGLSYNTHTQTHTTCQFTEWWTLGKPGDWREGLRGDTYNSTRRTSHMFLSLSMSCCCCRRLHPRLVVLCFFFLPGEEDPTRLWSPRTPTRAIVSASVSIRSRRGLLIPLLRFPEAAMIVARVGWHCCSRRANGPLLTGRGPAEGVLWVAWVKLECYYGGKVEERIEARRLETSRRKKTKMNECMGWSRIG